jgi:hypothetical protein
MGTDERKIFTGLHIVTEMKIIPYVGESQIVFVTDWIKKENKSDSDAFVGHKERDVNRILILKLYMSG